LISYSARWFIEPVKKVDWWIRINMKYSAGIPEKYFSQFKQDFQTLNGNLFAQVMTENQRFRLPDGAQNVSVPTLVVEAKENTVLCFNRCRIL
jgi:hypothetical protein